MSTITSMTDFYWKLCGVCFAVLVTVHYHDHWHDYRFKKKYSGIPLYKVKRQYLITCKVSRYCLFSLHGNVVVSTIACHARSQEPGSALGIQVAKNIMYLLLRILVTIQCCAVTSLPRGGVLGRRQQRFKFSNTVTRRQCHMIYLTIVRWLSRRSFVRSFIHWFIEQCWYLCIIRLHGLPFNTRAAKV